MGNVLYNAMYDFWLNDCQCNSRVVQCLTKRLQAIGVSTFEDLCGKTVNDISTIKYVGPDTMSFLDRFMRNQYLKFKESHAP